jgi:beta-lactam-binding protein with PASTA domain
MSLQGLSLGKLAIILIIAGVVIVFAISGFQARDVLFAPNITEETEVIIKDEQSNTCTVQAEDDVPRTISNCTYDVGDIISITYKREQPAILEHHLVNEG